MQTTVVDRNGAVGKTVKPFLNVFVTFLLRCQTFSGHGFNFMEATTIKAPDGNAAIISSASTASQVLTSSQSAYLMTSAGMRLQSTNFQSRPTLFPQPIRYEWASPRSQTAHDPGLTVE
jgi:hypothetical protein